MRRSLFILFLFIAHYANAQTLSSLLSNSCNMDSIYDELLKCCPQQECPPQKECSEGQNAIECKEKEIRCEQSKRECEISKQLCEQAQDEIDRIALRLKEAEEALKVADEAKEKLAKSEQKLNQTEQKLKIVEQSLAEANKKYEQCKEEQNAEKDKTNSGNDTGGNDANSGGNVGSDSGSGGDNGSNNSGNGSSNGESLPEPEVPASTAVQTLLEEMNKEREKVGSVKLSVTTRLECAAKRHSDDIGTVRKCTHTGSDGSSPWDRVGKCGTSAYGEIVACGQVTPRAAIESWLNSPAHKKIMLDNKFKTVGLAMFNNYWTAIFGY